MAREMFLIIPKIDLFDFGCWRGRQQQQEDANNSRRFVRHEPWRENPAHPEILKILIQTNEKQWKSESINVVREDTNHSERRCV
jgi:hypothetical protein